MYFLKPGLTLPTTSCLPSAPCCRTLLWATRRRRRRRKGREREKRGRKRRSLSWTGRT